jgi:hypothetical protein
MVAKVISGKNIRGLLNYNENKVSEGVAHCIAASGFGCGPQGLTFSDKLNRFRKVTALNQKVRTNAIHISLNFDVTEKLNNEQLSTIASDYMTRIGFGEQPYLVYRHADAAHPHVHIITTNVRTDGNRIDIHNIGRNQSEKARKEIEVAYGLVRAESRKKKRELEPVQLERAIYGKSETKRSISNVVRVVTRSYKYTSLPELNAILRQFNVVADRGAEGTQMHKKKGLLYSLLDEKGKKTGVPIKASAIYDKPILVNLEKRFKLNEVLRKPFRAGMKTTIDQVLKKPLSKDEFVKSLANRGVFVLFRENEEGRVYGVTFVDNRNKVVFNGSDLGKAYGAKAILDQLSQAPGATSSGTQSQVHPAEVQHTPEVDLHINELLKDMTTAQAYDFTSPEAAMKKRRKKSKRKGRLL